MCNNFLAGHYGVLTCAQSIAVVLCKISSENRERILLSANKKEVLMGRAKRQRYNDIDNDIDNENPERIYNDIDNDIDVGEEE